MDLKSSFGKIGATETVAFIPWSSFGSSHRGRPDYHSQVRRCPICKHQVDLAHDAALDEELYRTIDAIETKLATAEPVSVTGFALVR